MTTFMECIFGPHFHFNVVRPIMFTPELRDRWTHIASLPLRECIFYLWASVSSTNHLPVYFATPLNVMSSIIVGSERPLAFTANKIIRYELSGPKLSMKNATGGRWNEKENSWLTYWQRMTLSHRFDFKNFDSAYVLNKTNNNNWQRNWHTYI